VNNNIFITDFLDSKYREYALYTLHNRAIPSLSDGLKPVQRRVFWIAKKEAKDYIKISNLAGQCMKIHPHGNAALEGAIGNMAQDFCGANNISLLDGKGAFGCKILGSGKGIGAARYVSVKLSKFAKEVVYKDFDLIEEIPNYDGEYTECKTFLPLIPLVLLNGVSGIAVGFATEILPFHISDIIKSQIEILKKGKIDFDSLDDVKPFYKGFKGKIIWNPLIEKFETEGVVNKEKDFVRVIELPIGMNREAFIKVLDGLIEKEKIRDYEDYSKDEYDFRVFFRSRQLKEIEQPELVKMFRLTASLNENLTLLDTNDKLKIYDNIFEVIEEFTKWRFKFYKKRYEKLYKDLYEENDKKEELLRFITFVVKNDYVKKMTKLSREAIRKDLQKDFPRINDMLSLSISVFTEDNIEDLTGQIKENKKTLIEYDDIIKDDKKQKDIYIKELKEIDKEFNK